MIVQTPSKALRDRLLDRLASSAFGRKIEADVAAEEAKARAEVQAALLKLEIDYERALKPLQAKYDQAKKAWEATLSATEEAMQELRRAHLALRSTVNSHNGAKSVLERQLLATAPAAIDEFVAEMRAWQERLRNGEGRHVLAVIGYERGAPRELRFSNEASRREVMTAIGDAIGRADALRVDPAVTDADVPGALERLRKDLPAFARATVPQEFKDFETREVEG
jgi:hypothetical protein